MTASTDLPTQGYDKGQDQAPSPMKPPSDDAGRPEPTPAPADAGRGEAAPLGFRLVVAPAAGKVRHQPPARFQDGEEWVSAGQVLAIIEQGPSSLAVRAPVEARVAGILVRDGTPVLPGQPLLWLDQSPAPRRPGSSRRRT